MIWSFYNDADTLISDLLKQGYEGWAEDVRSFSESDSIKKNYYFVGFIVHLNDDGGIVGIDALLLTFRSWYPPDYTPALILVKNLDWMNATKIDLYP